ncbi:MAG: lysophospholipid acyltransferase family protein [Acidobacteriota bacterium]
MPVAVRRRRSKDPRVEILGEAARGAAAHAARAVAAGLPPEEGIPSFLASASRAFSELPDRLRRKIRKLIAAGLPMSLLDGETLEGIAALLRASASTILEDQRARARGDYEVDEFGLDPGYVERVKPLLRFMYRSWWRVETSGLENVPSEGRALFVANHSGVIAWDGAMIATAVMEEHPSGRLPRALHLEWFVRTPFAAGFLQRTGQVMACPENGERLLGRGHLVTVFPEGAKGAGKLFHKRYQLARFGRGGFVRMALRAGCPIIPVAVVGGEEIHPMLFKADPLARLFGLPYFPVTPTFPLLGPLGLIPLPSKWLLHFETPIDLSHLPPDASEDFHVVSQVSDDVRHRIQHRVTELLKRRGAAFF